MLEPIDSRDIGLVITAQNKGWLTFKKRLLKIGRRLTTEAKLARNRGDTNNSGSNSSRGIGLVVVTQCSG